ncbi:MAG: adenylate/guanylate cyclase domain-containing protein [Alphaproteobacteria bacterium]|nr:MAG: adenylate/guanylate cyclase domain-containing protein [Alphaproteobacteria bacterium]
MLGNILSKRWVQVSILLMLLVTAVGIRFLAPPFIGHMMQFTFDAYNRMMPREPAGENVVIVDIDEESLRRVGQWPWPRTVIGDMAVTLRQMGAKVVAFDIAFSEADRTSPARIADSLPKTPDLASVAGALKKLPDNDEVFARKIAEAGNIVTGFVGARSATGSQPIVKAKFCGKSAMPYGKDNPAPSVVRLKDFVTSLPNITSAAAGNGIFTSEPDDDGIIRNVPILVGRKDEQGEVKGLLPALALEALRISKSDVNKMIDASGGCAGYDLKVDGLGSISGVHLSRLVIPTDSLARVLVYYHGHRPGIYVPAWEVLQKKVDPKRFADKIVLIGTSSIGLLDLRSSPLDSVLPGVEIHAEVIEQVLNKQFLVREDGMKAKELLYAIVVSLLIIFLSPAMGGGMMALLVALALAAGIGGSIFAYTHGYLVDSVYPSVIIIIVFVLSSVFTNLRTELEKRMLRQVFDRYLSPALIEEMVKDPSRVKLGGDVRELSVMFTDIRNFTTISESMDPAELIRMMNDFLTPMTSAVLDNKGFVDKYMGDAMMTFWNAPVDDPHHAQNACRAALEMVEALKPVNAELKARAEKAGRTFYELKAGIGINSGRASVGNMGSKQRFAYSALGDTVNLASRMEGQTKTYGVTTMISHSTRMQVPALAAIELDLLTVKGRTEPERIYTLLGSEAVAKTSEFQSFAALHARMLEAYRAQKWDEATRLGDECARLKPELAALYKLYASRISHYKEEPPGPGWTGVWVAKEK